MKISLKSCFIKMPAVTMVDGIPPGLQVTSSQRVDSSLLTPIIVVVIDCMMNIMGTRKF